MPISKTIETEADIKAGIAALTRIDPRFGAIVSHAGQIPLRRTAAGFVGLARIIIAQQVSTQSADAIAARFNAHLPAQTPTAYLASSAQTRQAIGLSRPKQRTLETVSNAMTTGALNLEQCADMSAADAVAHMSAVKGIGPWTAEVYLLSCTGHPDIFPAGDLALQIAAHEAFGLPARPTQKQLRTMAESWAPWRAIAARILWSWYGTKRNRGAMP